ncbi:helix-turn-helix domain-containing protein [Geodermatophilus sp. URMC 64]
MARPLLRGDRLHAAREAKGLTREELATRLELSSPARIRVWELGLERPRPRFVPRLAAALGVDPLYLLDVDSDDPPLSALRLAAGLATNEVTAPGVPAVSLCSDITAADRRNTTSSSTGELLQYDSTVGSHPCAIADDPMRQSPVGHSRP